MNIGITGVSGFIGRHLAALCRKKGHRVVGFSRNPARLGNICDEARGFDDLDVDGCDAVVHLAGESVVGYWTQVKRERIRRSRLDGTRAVVDAISRAARRPAVFVSASAIGWYGETGESPLSETAPRGSGFLAEVAEAWENQAHRAESLDIRVAIVRIAVALGRDGGALRAMLPAFRLGAGARLGSGEQWFSWISVRDLAALFLFAVENDFVSGVLNGAAPAPVRNREYTEALAQAIGRPSFLWVPSGLMRTVLGDFSEELLGSRRVLPVRTQALGFQFQDPELKAALDSMRPL